MDTGKLSLILILGGVATTVVALIWFLAAYAEALEMASDFGGADYAASMMSCLYSPSALCQGAGIFSDAPAYTPVVFWIGVIALLGGIVVRFAVSKSAAAGEPASGDADAANGEILSFIPPGQFARYSYILALSGAVAGLIVMPLAIVGLGGFVLGFLGLTVYRPRLNALDVHHLGLLCLVFTAAGLLLYLTSGTFLFLLAALVQIGCLYVGFNSYRHGRIVTLQNLKTETLDALQPGRRPVADPDQP